VVVLIVLSLLYALVLSVVVAFGVVLGNLITAYLDPTVVRLREAGHRRKARQDAL
jgi:hypothetical protein